MSTQAGAQQDVVINLKLLADKNNANVLAKLLQDTNKVYAQIGESAQRAYTTSSAAATAASAKISTNGNALADRWEQVMQRVSASSVKAHEQCAAAAEKAGEQQTKAAKRVEASQAELIQKGLSGFADMATSAGKFAKSIAILGGANEESINQMAKSFEKLKQVFDTFKDGLELFKNINETLTTMKELSAAVQAASTAGSVARAGGKAAASTIQAGAGAAAGTAAEGGIAAVGASVASSIGSAAAIAAPIAGIVVAAVAVQEIFARLTGIGEGITGAMSGWYNAVEATRKST